MKLFLNYCVNTNMVQLRQDWNEFQKLKAQRKAKKQAMRSAYSDLITTSTEDEWRKVKSCIVQYQTSNENPTDAGDALPFNVEQYCDGFRFVNATKPCQLAGCPMVNKNHAYFAAMAEYNLAKQAVDTFWNIRMAARTK